MGLVYWTRQNHNYSNFPSLTLPTRSKAVITFMVKVLLLLELVISLSPCVSSKTLHTHPKGPQPHQLVSSSLGPSYNYDKHGPKKVENLFGIETGGGSSSSSGSSSSGRVIEEKMIKVFPTEISQAESDTTSTKTTTKTNTKTANTKSLKRIHRKTNTRNTNRKPFQPSPLVPQALPLPPNFGVGGPGSSSNTSSSGIIINGETKLDPFQYNGQTQYNAEIGVVNPSKAHPTQILLPQAPQTQSLQQISGVSSIKLTKGNGKIHDEHLNKSKSYYGNQQYGESLTVNGTSTIQPSGIQRQGNNGNKLILVQETMPVKSYKNYINPNFSSNLFRQEFNQPYGHYHQHFQNINNNMRGNPVNNRIEAGIALGMGHKSYKNLIRQQKSHNDHNGLDNSLLVPVGLSPHNHNQNELSPLKKQHDEFNQFYQAPAPTQLYGENNNDHGNHGHQQHNVQEEGHGHSPPSHPNVDQGTSNHQAQQQGPLGHLAEDHEQKNNHEVIHQDETIILNTLVGSKALMTGSIVIVFFLFIVVLAFAGLGVAGITVSPAIFPFAVLPIGIIALLLFIPLFLVFIPFVASGHAGRKKRRTRSIGNYQYDSLGLGETTFDFLTRKDHLFTLLLENEEDHILSRLFKL